MSGAPLQGKLLASPTNIRQGWKGLPEINTLSYYENLQITAVKSFIVEAQEAFAGLYYKHILTSVSDDRK